MFFWFLGILDNFPNFLFGASMDPSIVTACSSAAEGQSSWLSPKLCRVGVNVTGPIQHIINHICDRKDGLWLKKWNQSQNWSHILSISFLWYALCSTIFYHCKPRLSMSEASNASLQQIKLRSMQRKWIWRMSTRRLIRQGLPMKSSWSWTLSPMGLIHHGERSASHRSLQLAWDMKCTFGTMAKRESPASKQSLAFSP